MKLSHIINLLASPLNIAVTKKSSLDKIHLENSLLRSEIEKMLCGSQLSGPYRELARHEIAQKWFLVDYMERLTFRESVRERNCPICTHQANDRDFKKKTTHCIFGGGTLLRHVCPSCQLIFGPDKMFQLTTSELSQDYEWHYKVYEEGDSTAQELRTFEALQPKRDGVYINYGAGAWSQSVQRLRSQGWNVFAYEPHHSAISRSAGVISSLEELHTMRFDGIFSNNVLEHFRQPVNELQRLSSLLKPGGKMAHTTPCYEYLYEYTRFHLFFFPGLSRHILIEKAGLKEIEFIQDEEFMCSVMIPTH